MKQKIVTLLIAICMLCTMGMPVFGAENTDASKLGNPQKVSDGTVTWDCVWFGHYPQSSNGKGGFNNDPIKWRVLSVKDNEALLLADKNLDAKAYNETSINEPSISITWQTCTVRSWLNGYDNSSNQLGKNYTNENFLKKAFGSKEQEAIYQKTIQNPNNPEYGTKGGNTTKDKIFLLSIGEAMNSSYGFPSDDKAQSKTRQALNTKYAISRGANTNTYAGYEGNGWWWLRSPGHCDKDAAIVYGYGDIVLPGDDAAWDDFAIRPALRLNLKSNTWSYAGTVSSNGKMKEVAANKNGTVTKPKTATLKKVTSPKKGTLKLTWKRDKTATGYQAVVATDKNFKKNKKTATIKKNKTVIKTFTKLKNKKTYFAKVRAYKQVGKTKLYGAYSKTKKVKAK